MGDSESADVTFWFSLSLRIHISSTKYIFEINNIRVHKASSPRGAPKVYGFSSPPVLKSIAAQRKPENGPAAFSLMSVWEAMTTCLGPPLHHSWLLPLFVLYYIIKLTQDFSAVGLAVPTIFISRREDKWILSYPLYQTICNQENRIHTSYFKRI